MTQEFYAEGRIVWGHPAEGKKAVNMKTKQPKLNKNNEEYEEYAFGVAIPKDKFNEMVWPALYAEAAVYYPNGNFPADFSWKFKDGDTSTDSNGKPYSQYEGRAGCMILAIKSSSFAPLLVKWNGSNGYEQIMSNELKCGDYVAVKCSAEYNGNGGLYINPEVVARTGFGSEIKSGGPSAEQAFAGFTPTMQPGATNQPTMSKPLRFNPNAAPAVGGFPAAGSPVPVNQATQPMGQPLPAPATGFVANAGQQRVVPPMPGMMPPRL